MQWFIDPIQNHYADFEGRATRQEFWMYVLFYAIFYIVLNIVGMMVGLEVLGLLFSLAVMVPSWAIGARRLHDVDMSGWWQLIVLVPLLGLIVLVVLTAKTGQVADNRYGPSPYGSDGNLSPIPDLSDAPRPNQTEKSSVPTPPENNQG